MQKFIIDEIIIYGTEISKYLDNLYKIKNEITPCIHIYLKKILSIKDFCEQKKDTKIRKITIL